jgi:radical SAM superfamily enzyme YgiQ (UPF0313 family)
MKKNQVLLIQPPVEDFYSTDCRTQPAGLVYIASAIKKKFAKLDVVIYDALSTGKKRSIALPEEFSYLKKYYGFIDKSPFRLFHQYFRFGKTNVEMAQDLKNLHPFLIGISSLFSPYYRQSLEAAGICRELFPQAKIVFGGSHATSAPESLLGVSENSRYYGDYIIPGEGEILICELIDHILNPGEVSLPAEIITRDTLEKKIPVKLKPPDIDRLVEPDFSFLNKENYLNHKKPMRFCITSRGCPYHCSFCSIHTLFGDKYRRRCNESILSEIRQNITDGVLQIDIEDDHFTANKKETLELLETIIREFHPLTLTLMNGLVYWTLNPQLLEKMYQAGFRTLNLSLVSSHKAIHDAADRPDKKNEFGEIVKMAHGMGFTITAYFILGRPGQSIFEIADTLRLLASLPVLIGASPYYLSPGSPDYKLFKNSPDCNFQSYGKDHHFFARLACMDIETKDFNRDDIYTFFRLSRMLNYIKKGIDLELSPEHHFYDALKVIREPSVAPVSERVLKEVFANGITVTGFKKNNPLIFHIKNILKY